MNDLLDRVCPDDPDTLARQSKLDSKLTEFPQIVDDGTSKYVIWSYS